MDDVAGALTTCGLALIASLLAMAVRSPAFYLRVISGVVGWAIAVATILLLGAGIGATLGMGEWMIWTGAILLAFTLIWLGLMFLAIHVLANSKNSDNRKRPGRE